MKSIINDPWFTIEAIDSNTYAISEYGHWEKVHSYLLIGTKVAILIDTGLGISNIRKITDQLTTLPITVITTHVHWDHIGSHKEYDSIYVHENERDWLINGISLPLSVVRKDVIRDITVPLPEEFDINNYTIYKGTPTRILKGEEILDLGNRSLRIIHTPGHSPGHIVILDQTNGYLFSGDLLYDTTPIYAFYPTTNPNDLVESLDKIANLDNITKIYPSHNTLPLDPSILLEVKQAVQYLRDNDLVRFGTGIHKFNHIRIQF
ncbi:MBL fold metallo-hydrolase [Anaeromicropila herbilytica]|uniref:MBL fold metallo-hydrolase n=1 Tax=Anaeromicropila herbilytica TaxID=2785025 RepID=A0A7R7EKT7_9FIRM|nr:MBL fold metallo-hydrolase [Anaeromicropila herbilytica]BCN30598.1 MBL fold metallo-hydrolase [Anaeromicropila herbilytica]